MLEEIVNTINCLLAAAITITIVVGIMEGAERLLYWYFNYIA